MELTREQAIKEHRKMWHWLAENPDMDKDDYLELNDFEYVENECFLCHYSQMYPELKSDELVSNQIDIYNSNNKKIKKLKLQKIENQKAKFYLYFGG